MRVFRFILLLAVTGSLVWFLNKGTASIPPLGKFLSPYCGFWKNAEKPLPEIPKTIHIPGLQGEVKVAYDERLVPHIFAENEHDLFLAQGYITASLRLWQMEFQTHAASGRISEIVGAKAIEFDKTQRRKGLMFGAEKTIKEFENDPLSKALIDAYTEGVNAYISQLDYKELPLEYKLLNYRPEPWSNLKSAVLLKYMADMLTGTTYDLEYTQALSLVGAERFMEYYPDFTDTLVDPVIPDDTLYRSNHFDLDSGVVFTDDSIPYRETMWDNTAFFEGIGSNNWAVSGKRSATGAPLLCNDPHLGLNLPSLWFEIQLQAPGYNVYGVSLPGSPAVIIGFNESIAWGVTNGTEDVKDYFRMKLSDDGKSYDYNGESKPLEFRVEEIRVKGGKTVYDTVAFTHFGNFPFRGLSDDAAKQDIAVAWTGWEPSNELMTFYYLNKAAGYEDYTRALSYYKCPAQNFVFASKSGDIALWHNGKFPLKWPGQGKVVMDGSLASSYWQGFIPFEENPHILNPRRNFVSSANQHPASEAYPYYYTGRFEYYRNRRINDRLQWLDSATVEDMMKLQCDNYNLLASEMLPLMIRELDEPSLLPSQAGWLAELKGWNYMNDPDLKSPVIFKIWFDELKTQVWDEMKESILPQDMVLYILASQKPSHTAFDRQETDKTEMFADMAVASFRSACKQLDSLKTFTWASYKNTTLTHLARVIAPFNMEGLHIGGNSGIVNACSAKNGPSWRMIVSLEENTRAFGSYPGGQSGNPGSHFYINQVEAWTKGEYYPLWFMKSPEDTGGKTLVMQRLIN